MPRTPSRVIMKGWSGCPMGALSLGGSNWKGKARKQFRFLSITNTIATTLIVGDLL